MSDHFEITLPNKVPSFSQLIGKYKPYVSCFPTSVAMCIKHCLNILGLKKDVIGCAEDVFLEDYVNNHLEDPDTIAYIKKNGIGDNSWWSGYFKSGKQRQIHAVEAYVFNHLMNSLGFKAEFKALTYDQYCETLEKNNLPIIISGDFTSTTNGKVSGHMNVGVGFNKIGVREFVTNDPYGDGRKGYPNTGDTDTMRAEYIRYPAKFFINKDNLIYGVVISAV